MFATVISREEQLSREGGGKYLVTLLGGLAASLKLHHVTALTARGEPKHVTLTFIVLQATFQHSLFALTNK